MIFGVIDGSVEVGFVVLRFFVVVIFGGGSGGLDNGMFDGLDEDFFLTLLVAH
jgi:hypothetical protein